MLFISLGMNAQQTSADSTAEYGFGFCRFGLKGKVLPWFIGNAGGLNGLIGAELGFAKIHTVGVDYFFHATQDHHDQENNQPSLDNYSFNRAFFFNYRIYLENLYTGVFAVSGKKNESWDKGFNNQDSTLNQTRNYKGVGLLFGCKWRFNDGTSRFGIDINVQPFYNIKNVHNKIANGNDFLYTDAIFKTIDFRVGVNLFWFIRD